MNKGRHRMIFDLPARVQIAIRLRAIKNGWTTSEVVKDCIRRAFPAGLEEARLALESQQRALPISNPDTA